MPRRIKTPPPKRPSAEEFSERMDKWPTVTVTVTFETASPFLRAMCALKKEKIIRVEDSDAHFATLEIKPNEPYFPPKPPKS